MLQPGLKAVKITDENCMYDEATSLLNSSSPILVQHLNIYSVTYCPPLNASLPLLPDDRIFGQITKRRPTKNAHWRKKLEAVKLQNLVKSGRKKAGKYFTTI
jgi:hypothetical protein